MSSLFPSLVALVASPVNTAADVSWLLAKGGLLAEGAAQPNPLASFLPILVMGLLAYFLMIAPQRSKQKQFQQMIDNLKENDRIVTTGGLHGVVTNIQRDAGRLTLRVDETSGAKIRVSLWAIDSVVNEDK